MSILVKNVTKSSQSQAIFIFVCIFYLTKKNRSWKNKGFCLTLDYSKRKNEEKDKTNCASEQRSSHIEALVSPVSNSRCLTQEQEARANCQA